MLGIIYSATNKTNCITYVGQTFYSLQKRKKSHFSETRNKKDNNMFHNAIRKHGEDNFIWDVIATYKHTDIQKLKSILNKAEMYYINAYDTFNDGYNLTEGGGGSVGWNHTEETIQKMHENHANVSGEKNPMYKRAGENHPMYGKKHKKETIQKMSEIKIGENHPMYGKKHKKETIQKMSEIKIGEKNPMYGKPAWNKGMAKTEMKIYRLRKYGE